MGPAEQINKNYGEFPKKPVNAVYISFNTGNPDVVGKWQFSDIGVHGSVTNFVVKVKWIKIPRNFQTKKYQNNVVHTST